MKFRSLINNVNVVNATQAYVDTAVSTKLSTTGGTMTGPITLASTPTLALEAATKEYADTTSLNASNPTGTVIEISTVTTPTNYLRANGTQVSKTTYANLFAVIGETYATTIPGKMGQPWRQQYSFNMANSTIGAWGAGIPLPITIYYSQAIVTNNRVYLLGGNINNVISSAVYTAPINPDGTIGTWVIDTPLPVTIINSQAIVTNNRVYLLGGTINSYSSTTVYTAPINPDGTLGAWVTNTPLPGMPIYPQVILTNSRIYIFTVFPEMYSAPFSGGLNNYINLTSINATTFTLPDYTIIDTASSPKSYHYIKF